MRRLVLVSVLASSLVVAPTVLADVTPPDVTACQGKSIGAACTEGSSSGACTAGKCSKLDYSGWDRDASSSPPTIQYDCVKCVAGATPDAGAQTSSGGDGGGCSMSVRRVGSWALAAVPAIVLALWGRRRSRR